MTTDDELVERFRQRLADFPDNPNVVSLVLTKHGDEVLLTTDTRDIVAEERAAADRISLLREALEPFAKWAAIYPADYPDDTILYGTVITATGAKHTITLGEARRARQALASSGGGG